MLYVSEPDIARSSSLTCHRGFGGVTGVMLFEETGREACLWRFYIFLRFSTRTRTICGATRYPLPQKASPLASRSTDPTLLFVTWRLAGSIPRARLPQPHAGAPLSAGRAFLVLDREVDQAAFGPVWLRDARVARVVADVLMYGESGRHIYHIRAWGDHCQQSCPTMCIDMLLPKTSLPVILGWWKGCTARPANLILGRTGEAFWQDESFDHCVRDEAELGRLVRYVEYHPVSAGLAANPRARRWSSI